MAVFSNAPSRPLSLQGVQVSSAFPDDQLKCRFNIKMPSNIHLQASVGLHQIPWGFRGNKLPVYTAPGVVFDKSETETVIKEAKPRRRRSRMIAIETDSALLTSETNSLKRTTEAKQQELHTVHEIREGHPFKYSEVVPEVLFQEFADEQRLSLSLVKYIAQVSRESVDTRGRFTIALSGGSLVKALEKLVDGAFIHVIDWSKWHVFWVDERVVPLTHGDSNYKLAMNTFLSKVKVPKSQIYSIQYSGDANVVAEKYGCLIRELVVKKVLNLDQSEKFPCFDMILLGIGPDGHVASLFPNSLALAEEQQWVVAVPKSPKPPLQRISFTLPCINSASHVVIVVTGFSKAEILQRVLERPALPGALPAQMVRPSNGSLNWFVDKEATSKISVDAWDDSKRFPSVNFGSAKITDVV